MPIKAKYNGSYKDITDLMNVDESIDYVLAKTSSSYKRVYTATRSIEDTPPTTFKSIKPGANLIDYRIYGQTSRNLFDMKTFAETCNQVYGTVNYINNTLTFTATNGVDAYVNSVYNKGAPVYVGERPSCIDVLPSTTYTISMSSAPKCYISWLNSSYEVVSSYTQIPANQKSYTFTTPSNCTKLLIRLGKEVTNIGDTFTISDIMLNEGPTPLPYEPYGESVGDRTGNLFYKKIENANIASNDGRIYSTESFDLWIGKVKAGETYTSYNTNAIVGFFTDEPDYGAYTYDNSRITNATSVFTFTVPNGCSYVGVRILKNDPTAMLNLGDTALPYEPYGYKVPVTTDCSMPHTATLQLHDCLPSTMQFDAPEALYYAENGLTAGTYNFTIQDRYDTSYGGGKTYQFTLANDVPAKGQLVFGWSYKTQASAAKITSYASSTSTTAIEQVGVTEGSGGTSLGTTDGNSTNVNHIHRARYSSNNYKESAIRQFLNSSAVAGSVWTPQTKYDRPPSWNASTAGFMKDIDSDFLAVLGASPKVVALNPVTDGGGSVTINNDKFFLLSRSEVYGGKENNINEGEPYPYYSNYSDLSAAGVGEDSNRIKYRSGTAQIWWLRSPDSAFGRNARYVGTSGLVGNYLTASYSHGVAPACNIVLDEDYKFNGQVLHVRDQISVTKGNQTLVFDVIGIDHDEVHFDKTTTNIYLPEPIKMVGDEAEYIDYAEQKQHRVRKNLWSGVVEQGGVSERGDYVSNTKRIRSKNVPLEPGTYAISTNLLLLVIYAFNDTQKIGLCASIYQGSYSYTITVPAGANNISIGMMKVVDGVQVDITPSDFEWGQVEKGSEVTNYEPYIENTEVDVTLPDLPTLPGTNVLSVGTEVQPSKIDITGHIKTISGGS